MASDNPQTDGDNPPPPQAACKLEAGEAATVIDRQCIGVLDKQMCQLQMDGQVSSEQVTAAAYDTLRYLTPTYC